MTGWLEPRPRGWTEDLWDAFFEDVGHGDVSAFALDPAQMLRWRIEAQENGVLCGCGLAASALGPRGDEPDESEVEVHAQDGDRVAPGEVVLSGLSSAPQLLAVERTALNFLMHLSGVATLTRKFVEAVEGLDVAIVDTRKTMPNLRPLQKYAVRCGGGRNHRMGLYDGVMLKDNHIKACGSISAALKRFRAHGGHMYKVEVECETTEQVIEAVAAGADVVMLDNMDPATMAKVAKQFRNQVTLEASGGVTLQTVCEVARTGVHLVSVGALTHSAPALPFHLEVT